MNYFVDGSWCIRKNRGISWARMMHNNIWCINYWMSWMILREFDFFQNHQFRFYDFSWQSNWEKSKNETKLNFWISSWDFFHLCMTDLWIDLVLNHKKGSTTHLLIDKWWQNNDDFHLIQSDHFQTRIAHIKIKQKMAKTEYDWVFLCAWLICDHDLSLKRSSYHETWGRSEMCPLLISKGVMTWYCNHKLALK